MKIPDRSTMEYSLLGPCITGINNVHLPERVRTRPRLKVTTAMVTHHIYSLPLNMVGRADTCAPAMPCCGYMYVPVSRHIHTCIQPQERE